MLSSGANSLTRWLQYGCGAEPGVPRTPEQRAGFARFAVEMMAHFAGRGIVWEVWVSFSVLLVRCVRSALASKACQTRLGLADTRPALDS